MNVRERLHKYRANGTTAPSGNASDSTEPSPLGLEIIEETLLCHPEAGLSLSAPERLQLAPGEQRERSKILFLDVECLSLGTGPANIPWLIGTGSFTDKGFLLRLLLCHTPPAESDSLAFLDEIWANHDTILTYNGASFDIPLLKSRYALYRKNFPERPLTHYDLYRVLRRIYPAKPQRLIDAEERILGFRRKDDLPGSYAGQAYFEYQRYARRNLLDQIMRHNRADVATLAALALKLDEAIRATAAQYPVWAPKIHKIKEATPQFILQGLAAKTELDAEDRRLAAEAYEKLGQLRRAAREYCRAARNGEAKAVLPLLKILIKLNKKKLSLAVIDYFLYISEANLQEKLLAKRQALLKSDH